MSTSTPAQELLDLWRKNLEEGTQAWLRAMGQGSIPQAPIGVPPAAFDFTQLWRPLLSQGMEVWQKAAAQGALTPDFMQQWKSFMNQWIETWSKTLERAMGTDTFAQALGHQLDQWMAVQGPLRKGLEQQSDAALRTLGLPSRGQVVSLASQVVALEERIEGIEDRLAELRTLLKDVLADRARGGGATTSREPREGP